MLCHKELYFNVQLNTFVHEISTFVPSLLCPWATFGAFLPFLASDLK